MAQIRRGARSDRDYFHSYAPGLDNLNEALEVTIARGEADDVQAIKHLDNVERQFDVDVGLHGAVLEALERLRDDLVALVEERLNEPLGLDADTRVVVYRRIGDRTDEGPVLRQNVENLLPVEACPQPIGSQLHVRNIDEDADARGRGPGRGGGSATARNVLLEVDQLFDLAALAVEGPEDTSVAAISAAGRRCGFGLASFRQRGTGTSTATSAATAATSRAVTHTWLRSNAVIGGCDRIDDRFGRGRRLRRLRRLVGSDHGGRLGTRRTPGSGRRRYDRAFKGFYGGDFALRCDDPGYAPNRSASGLGQGLR